MLSAVVPCAQPLQQHTATFSPLSYTCPVLSVCIGDFPSRCWVHAANGDRCSYRLQDSCDIKVRQQKSGLLTSVHTLPGACHVQR